MPSNSFIFSDYQDFNDFCKKEGFTPDQARRILIDNILKISKEIEELKERN